MLTISKLDGTVAFRRVGAPGEDQWSILQRLVEECVASDDPAMKDWTGLDLTHRNFSGTRNPVDGMSPEKIVSVRGLKFDDSKIAGSCWDRVDGTDASFRRVKAHPSGSASDKEMQKTRFRGFISRGGTKFDGMEGAGVEFDHSEIKGGSFRLMKQVDMSAKKVEWLWPDLAGSDQKNSDYTDGTITNGSWQYSIVERPKLHGAKVADTTHKDINGSHMKIQNEALKGAGPLKRGTWDFVLHTHERKSFSDRYRGAVFIGIEKDDKTELPEGTLQVDANMAGHARQVSGALAAFSVWGVGQAAGIIPDPSLSNFSNQVIGVTAVYLAARTKDWALGGIAGPLDKGIRKVADAAYVGFRKEFLPNMHDKARRLKLMSDAWKEVRLVGLFGSVRSLGPVMRALQATAKAQTNNPFRALWQHGGDGKQHYVVCDRRHLAVALEHISRHRDKGYRLPHDVTIVRENTEEWYGDTPATVTYKKDGTKVIGWQEGGRMTHLAVYDKDGKLTEQTKLTPNGAEQVPIDGPLLRGVERSLYTESERKLKGKDRELLQVFENSLIDDHMADDEGFTWFNYDPDRTMIVAGADNSINFVNRRTGEHDNPHMYAFRANADGEPDPKNDRFIIEGKVVTEQEFLEVAGPQFAMKRGFDPFEGDPFYDTDHPDFGKSEEEIVRNMCADIGPEGQDAYDEWCQSQGISPEPLHGGP